MTKLPPRQIILDFDATCVLHDNPFIGEEIDGCVKVLKRLVINGHSLILSTMRVDNLLDDAISWFKVRDIPVRLNPDYETGSRKTYGHIILDDKCCGIPLIHDTTIHPKPFVNWAEVEKILEQRGFL